MWVDRHPRNTADPMTTSEPIRILCVEDHRIVREGIRLLLEREPDLAVVAVAETGEQAVSEYRAHRPDVTLMDLQLPGMSGLDAIRAIRKDHPDARIVVLTMYQGDEAIFRALEAGAATYLLKDSLADELIDLVRGVHAGERPMLPAIEAKLSEHSKRPRLTPREVEVIKLVSEGFRNREIAAMLGISEETAQVHLRNIFQKLGTRDRTAAVQVALRRGILHIR